LIGAIVLAAGKSERMGTPKALLTFRGKTFLEHILDAIPLSAVDRTIVVVGHHRREIESHVRPNISLVFNPDYERGMVTSFQTGIRALPDGTDGALLFLVDHPIVDPATIESILPHTAPNRIVLPVFEGRRGHPVFFGRLVLNEIIALSPDQGANIVVRKDPSRVIEVPVSSAGILADIDTPEDFQNLQNEYESR
jgi:molybdenum cofactor cytidylyltransferase